MLVSLYPRGSPAHGVADYTRSLALALAREGRAVEVWAERTPTAPRAVHERDAEVTVYRVWRPGAWVGPDLWRQARRDPPPLLHVQFEPFTYGGPLGFLSLWLFLVWARLAGALVVVTLHHVVAPHELTAEVLARSGIPLPPSLVRAACLLSTRLLASLAHGVVVHADVFRHRLATAYGVEVHRVAVVPHGVPSIDPAATSPADPPGGERVLLLFGFLKWYKGIDLVLEAFRQVAHQVPGWRLVVAGGLPARPSTVHRRYAESLRRLSRGLDGRVEFLGHVPDEHVPRLFHRADLVLFPYRLLFAASGPLALAIGWRRPMVISTALRPLLPQWPWVCPAEVDAWAATLRRLMEDGEQWRAARARLADLAPVWAWPEVARRTAAIYAEMTARAPSVSRPVPTPWPEP